MTSPRPRRGPGPILVAGGALIVVVLTILAGPALGQWYNASIVSHPAPFTELSFTDPNNLPQRVVAGRTYRVEVTVRNQENEDVTYPFMVVATLDGPGQLLGTGRVFVGKGRTVAFAVPFGVPQGSRHANIAFFLPSKREHVDFWVIAGAPGVTSGSRSRLSRAG